MRAHQPEFVLDAHRRQREAIPRAASEALDVTRPAVRALLHAAGHDPPYACLATASLALWGLLYADRYDMINGNREYTWLWRQLYALFWTEKDEHVSERKFLLLFVELQRTAESEAVLETFSLARKSYTKAIEELGLLPSDIKAVIDKPQSVRPRVYVGGRLIDYGQDGGNT